LALLPIGSAKRRLSENRARITSDPDCGSTMKAASAYGLTRRQRLWRSCCIRNISANARNCLVVGLLQKDRPWGDGGKPLVENVVPFRESNPESLNYWIVADETCVAFGFPGPEGSKRGHERSVDILAKYRDPRTMLDECKFIGLP